MPLTSAEISKQAECFVRYGKSFYLFAKEVLGFKDMNAEHEALCEYMQHDPAPVKLILMPRYTFKSCLCTQGHSLWCLTRDDSERILFYSDSNEKAEGFLHGVKLHITGQMAGSRFRELYGPWEVDAKRGVWNQSAIVVKARQFARTEPSIDTAGIESSKVGMHYDRMKFDDLVSDKNVTTKELMDKVESCYTKALSLLRPGGHVELVGTRWHFGDLYGRLIAKYKGEKGFSVFHRKAYEGEKYFFQDIGQHSLTPEFLQNQKAAQGTYTFSCLYQNEPVDDETAAFKAKDFAFYEPTMRSNRNWWQQLFLTCCVDPAISQAKDADQTAITIVGTDHDWNLYVLEMVAGRMLPEDTLQTIFDLHRRWPFQVLGIETTAFQRMLSQDLQRRLWAQKRLDPNFQIFRVEEFSGITQRSKEQRILGLQPYHEQGRLKLPGTRLELLSDVWQTLAYQLLQFPHSAHDDLMDSLAYHIQLARPGQPKKATEAIPHWSIAAVERRQYERAVHANEQQPRWLRQNVHAPVWS